ncbi:MAG TPA: hypothetical protein DIU39_02160 [Flavobacteriales bacterium]|nr:hypothetical protein [Flavobacteriales bacterium]|tara:strand:- start:117836 stop:118267 length:432 start_codon:yes stop_codon:yes gene_type:complete
MMRFSLFHKIIYIFLIIILFGCQKNEQNGVPIVSVDIYIYTTDPDFVDLNAVGNWTYVTGGSRGIIVYRYSNNEFKAYDRHCPYQSQNSCALVTVESSNITAKDDCCGSTFLLTDGSVTGGPATFPLKQYRTSFDGTVLHIYN